MKILLALFLFSSIVPVASMAQAGEDLSNGNLIAEPTLTDYSHATRTPGFSPITDIVDANGN